MLVLTWKRGMPRPDVDPRARPFEALGSRTQCGNPACSGRWLAFLKDRCRPVFEGQWGCSAKCVEAMVKAAIRREAGEGGEVEDGGEHHHRVPLGLILLTRGWINHSQLQHALDMQRRAGRGRIGDWLIKECGLKEECVIRGLAVQWRCPVLPVEGFKPEAMALTMPKVLVDRLGMVPLRIVGESIFYLAFEDRLDASAAFAMERMSGLKSQSGLADGAELQTARRRLCECDFVDARVEHAEDVAAMAKKAALALNELQPRASRLVRVHQFYWLRMWLEMGAMRTRDGGIPVTKEDVVDRIYMVGVEQ